ncbi:Glyoxylase, beta-lactamase superfamily II [Granulicella pectinivorans]|uniref:Glyoxylase, beta-lactamase superfamily II n=1 Tax=Granulicella pectinivorans TaxID=474950 RepID=A0A1I6LXI0_9BACT|nr:MBL fold metallo-hydrolase [Granulicella pectinivorans]SFS08084.1 Glyoxylase, beta-lactamase superfamily II [Granulicella pectinivorans]
MSRIVRVPILPLKIVNAHLLIGDKGCLLIDAGLPGSAAKVEKVLSKNGLTFGDIKAIVITHAHVDHAGGAAELREKTRAPIIAHKDDLPYYKREIPMTFCPTGKVGRYFLKTPLPHQSYTAFEPDVLLSNGNSFDLAEFGIQGTVRHTPGHTKGSISVELGSKEALVGDLVASGLLIGGVMRLNRAIRPPFEDNPEAVRSELLRLVDAGIDRFYMGHGGPLDAHEVRRHAKTLVRMP